MKKLAIAIAFIVPSMTFAQEGALRKAQKDIDNLAYAEAIDRYEHLLEHGTDTTLVAKGLGDSYFALRDMHTAADWYSKADESTFDTETQCQFNMALRSKGVTNTDVSGCVNVDQTTATTILNQLNTETGRFKVEEASFNQEGSDFGPVFLNDQLIFVSDRNDKASVKKRFSWNNRPFLDLFILREDKFGKLYGERIGGKINTNLHEGPGSFTSDGTTFYFTRNQETSDGTRKLEILSSNWSEGEWTDPVGFVHNSTAYSTGHPAVSADDQFLFFASDMEGSVGGTDIWYCTKMDDGTWSAPANAGTEINTTANELFPSCDRDGYLYFASDGHTGLGGLDLFETEIQGGDFTTAVNMGAPINSTSDDFSITMNRKSTRGYFSSNRKEDATNDDIYSFAVTHERMFTVKGQVVSNETQEAIGFCNVHLINDAGETIATTTCDENGNFTVATEDALSTVAKVEVDAGPEFSTGFAEAETFEQVRYTSDAGTIGLDPLGLVGFASLMQEGTNETLSGVNVSLFDKTTGNNQANTTNDNGKVTFDLAANTTYEIVVAHEGYFTQSGHFTTGPELAGAFDLAELSGMDLTLEKIELNKTVRIENINYDYNDYRIRNDAGHELDKIVALLTDNPTMKIELGSHTDARGSDSYNMKLSRKRAKAAVEYMVSKGIDADRMAYKGYGETTLLNDCGNGNDCSDEEHEQNRRTEFKVIDF